MSEKYIKMVTTIIAATNAINSQPETLRAHTCKSCSVFKMSHVEPSSE
ncbi:hypothetical protein MGSAQ_001538 [marine sediment metagenome]|uniref:Uncharacterized protein n=1 Tax=marine sediment metagenome TaxID=412755 RepID=A0A1B6NU09_9ZZZZ